MKTNNTLGDTIRSLRKRAKMTQEELAEGICSAVSISRIENGVQMPSGTVLDAILAKLGTSTYQLCSIYYKTDRQLVFEQKLQKVKELLRIGRLEEAKTVLSACKVSAGEDNHNRQCYLLMSAAIRIDEKTDPAETVRMIQEAIALTRPSFDETSFRETLLTVQEANLLNELMAALFLDGQSLRAIRVGEELMYSLRKNQSSLEEYRVMQINAGLLLAQILKEEQRHEEALAYCLEAKELSIKSSGQVLLPEIELIKATLYHAVGRNDECLSILQTIIPYMDLIQRTDSAEAARTYARDALGINL